MGTGPMRLSRALSGVGLLLAAVLCAIIPGVAAAEDTVAFTIKDARITESSGLAVDPAGNIYWTVNDSGDRGVAYGIGLDGKVQGSLNFRAQPVDVEAVAVHKDRLYVGDIGDNNGRRSFVRIFYFNNPRANGLTVSYHAYDFRYLDGPHNVETLLVNDSDRLFIVTKGQEAAVYAAPSKPDRQGVNKLKKVGTAPSGVTDGTFLPSGDKIALLTYGSVVVIDASTYEVLASFPIPHQPKAGSLTLSLDEKSLLVGPKGKKSKVYTVPVPGEASPGPRQAPAKTQAPTPMSQRTRPMPFRTRRELDWHSGSLLSWRRLILPVAGVRAEGRRAGDQARRSAARRLFGIRRVASSPEYVAGGGLRSVWVSPLHVVRCQ